MIGLILKKDPIISKKKFVQCIEEYCNLEIKISSSKMSNEKLKPELIFGILWFLKVFKKFSEPGGTRIHVTFTLIQCSCFLCVTAGTFAIKRSNCIHTLRRRGTSVGIRLAFVYI